MRLALAALVLLTGCHAQSDQEKMREFNRTHPVGHYEPVVRPDGSVWILDTQTGAIQRCDLPQNGVGNCWKSLPVR
jgi:streptogramin lyase